MALARMVNTRNTRPVCGMTGCSSCLECDGVAVPFSAAWWPEVEQDLARVVGLPGFGRSLGRELLVEADEQVDQVASHRAGAQQVRQLRQVDEPLRVPGSPVVVCSVDDPENAVVGLACLMEQCADLLQRVRHLIPLTAASGIKVIMARQVGRNHNGSYTAL